MGISSKQVAKLKEHVDVFMVEMQVVDDPIVEGWTHWWGSLTFLLDRIIELEESVRAGGGEAGSSMMEDKFKKLEKEKTEIL